MFQSCDDLNALPGLQEATRSTRMVQELGVTLRMLRQQQDLPKGSGEACQRVADDLKVLEAVITGASSSTSSPTASTVKAEKSPTNKLRQVVNAAIAQKSSGGMAHALNDMIKILWPRIDTFVEDLIHNSIEPSINASLPGLLKGGVKFPKVSLGAASPLLGPIYVDHNKESGAIEMHIGIDFTSDLNVELLVMGVPIGITSIFLRGDLILLFSPPLMKPPFFGGVQVYFPNPPDVGLNFVGVAKVANVPGLRGAIRGAIDGAIAGVCVLPRRIAVDTNDDDDVDIVDLSYPEPLGILRFTLYSASGLMAADRSLSGRESSDPYVVASLGIKKWQSPHISKTLNPVWGDSSGLTVDFPVHDDDQALILKILDYDFGSSDDLIGTSNIVVRDLLAMGGGEQELNVLKADGSAGGGTLTISAQFLHLAAAKPVAPLLPAGPSEAHLSMKVLLLRGIKEHSEYPFKVVASVIHPADGRAKKTASATVVHTESTRASHPKERKHLSEALQGIAKNLAEKQLTGTEIAEILDVGPHQVKEFLHTLPGSERTKQQQQAEQDFLNVRKPMFEEVVQFLLPCGSVVGSASIELAITDKRNKVLATARMPMPHLLEAPDLFLEGPFETDVEGIEVVGSLKLRWLS